MQPQNHSVGTIHIYSCAETPQGRLCCQSMVL
jgi:hypothetical protein